jgi:hypothetical protein
MPDFGRHVTSITPNHEGLDEDDIALTRRHARIAAEFAAELERQGMDESRVTFITGDYIASLAANDDPKQPWAS